MYSQKLEETKKTFTVTKAKNAFNEEILLVGGLLD